MRVIMMFDWIRKRKVNPRLRWEPLWNYYKMLKTIQKAIIKLEKDLDKILRKHMELLRDRDPRLIGIMRKIPDELRIEVVKTIETLERLIKIREYLYRMLDMFTPSPVVVEGLMDEDDSRLDKAEI